MNHIKIFIELFILFLLYRCVESDESSHFITFNHQYLCNPNCNNELYSPFLLETNATKNFDFPLEAINHFASFYINSTNDDISMQITYDNIILSNATTIDTSKTIIIKPKIIEQYPAISDCYRIEVVGITCIFRLTIKNHSKTQNTTIQLQGYEGQMLDYDMIYSSYVNLGYGKYYGLEIEQEDLQVAALLLADINEGYIVNTDMSIFYQNNPYKPIYPTISDIYHRFMTKKFILTNKIYPGDGLYMLNLKADPVDTNLHPFIAVELRIEIHNHWQELQYVNLDMIGIIYSLATIVLCVITVVVIASRRRNFSIRPVSMRVIGASVDTISNLKEITFNEKTTKLAIEDRNCCICLGDYENDDKLRELPCLHTFHADCIDKCLKTNKKCPLCQQDIDKTPKVTLKRSINTIDIRTEQTQDISIVSSAEIPLPELITTRTNNFINPTSNIRTISNDI